MANTASGLAATSGDCSPRIIAVQGRGRMGRKRGRNFRPRRALLCVVKPNRRASGSAGRGTRSDLGRRGESPHSRRSATSAREPVSSPRRRNGRRETYVVDHRPSDLDPYPRAGRDLAALQLWDQSLERSRQRRRLIAKSRSHRQRRKGASVAGGAAMLAAPVVPAFAGSTSRGGGAGGGSGSGGRADTALDMSSLAAATGGRTQLLRFGDV